MNNSKRQRRNPPGATLQQQASINKQVTAVFGQLVVALHRESRYLNGEAYLANAWAGEVRRAVAANVSFFNKVMWSEANGGWERVPRERMFEWVD